MFKNKAFSQILHGMFILGLLFVFFGENAFPVTSDFRIILDFLGLLSIITALISRLFILNKLKVNSAVQLRFFYGYLSIFLALIIYFAQCDLIINILKENSWEQESIKSYQMILTSLYIIILIISIIYIMFIEMTFIKLDQNRTVDLNRIKYSSRTAFIIGLSLIILFTTNFLIQKVNTFCDVSFGQSSKPSDASEKLFRSLTEELRIVLFYPSESEVLNELSNYFTYVKNLNPKIIVEIKDLVYYPEDAEKYKISENGNIIFNYGKVQQKLEIANDMRNANAIAILKELDKKVYEQITKATTKKKTAYFTRGHGERLNHFDEKDPRMPVSFLSQLLRDLNYSVEDIGLKEGLGDKVPDKADILFIIDPQQKFMENELKSIDDYLKRGGNVFLTLDSASNPENWINVLDKYNVKINPYPLATPISIVQGTSMFPDGSIILGNTFSTHKTVTTLSKLGPRAAILFPTSISLSEVKKPASELDFLTDIAIKSDNKTWIDYDKNYKKDNQTEKDGSYGLMAVVTLNKPKDDKNIKKANLTEDTSDDAKLIKASLDASKENNQPALSKDSPITPAIIKSDYSEMKLIILADTDAISDVMLRAVQTNQLILIDSLKWMFNEENLMGELPKESDKPIIRTKDESKMLFWLLNIGIPLVILMFGISYLMIRKKRSKIQ